LNSTKKEMANMADDIKEIQMEALKTSENMEKNLFNISENLENRLLNISADGKRTSDNLLLMEKRLLNISADGKRDSEKLSMVEKRLLNISADGKRTSEKLSMIEENLLNISEEAKKNSEDMKSKLQNILDLLKNHTTEPTDNLIRGVIISGGYNGKYLSSTEVFFPPTSSGVGYSCSLQSMPSPRWGHTLDQLGDGTVLACGGSGDADTLKTCDKFDGTSWSQRSTLQYSRVYHTSLPGQHDLLLMGGYYSQATTELVGGDEQYNLQQDTSYACGITVTEPGSDNTIILTGGYGPMNTVAKYGPIGFIGALPNLQIARYGHGCGVVFVTGKKVFVVAGGYNDAYLDSTELLYEGGDSWVTGKALPRTLFSPASVSLPDSVLLLGGAESRREILSFNASLAWSVVGTLQQERSDAAAAAATFPSGHLDLSSCPE